MHEAKTSRKDSHLAEAISRPRKKPDTAWMLNTIAMKTIGVLPAVTRPTKAKGGCPLPVESVPTAAKAAYAL